MPKFGWIRGTWTAGQIKLIRVTKHDRVGKVVDYIGVRGCFGASNKSHSDGSVAYNICQCQHIWVWCASEALLFLKREHFLPFLGQNSCLLCVLCIDEGKSLRRYSSGCFRLGDLGRDIRYIRDIGRRGDFERKQSCRRFSEPTVSRGAYWLGQVTWLRMVISGFP